MKDNERTSPAWVKYLVNAILALICFLLAASGSGLWSSETAKDFFAHLSDCFLIPGVFVGGCGALAWMAHVGAYDMLGFGGRSITERFKPGEKHFISYYEYKQEKAEKRGEKMPLHGLIVGGVCLRLSAVCLCVYLVL